MRSDKEYKELTIRGFSKEAKKFRLHLVARNTEIHGRGKC